MRLHLGIAALALLCPTLALAQVQGGSPSIAAITSGTINGTPVGATTPSTGAFTSLTSTSGALNGSVGATTPSTGVFTSSSSTTYGTATNCSSGASPAVCGSAAAGSAAVPTGTNPTLQINTTAVTANSQILVTPDETLGTKLTVTCNTTVTTVAPIIVTARSPGASFTVQVDATVGTNPVCLSYLIVN